MRRFPSFVAAVLAAITVAAAMAGPAGAGERGERGGGNVLPPSAHPLGYSLADMTRILAPFTASGNNPAYFNNPTPFRILFVDPANFNAQIVCPVTPDTCSYVATDPLQLQHPINVKRGTTFFVPVDNADDSPPIVGHFPTSPTGGGAYLFDPAQVGARGFSITIDGERTTLGPA